MYSGSVHMFYPQWPTPQSARQKTLVESLAWVRETRPLWIGLSQNIHAFSLSLSQSGRTHTEERPIAWNKNYVQQSTHTHTLHEMNNHIQLIFFPFFIYIYIWRCDSHAMLRLTVQASCIYYANCSVMCSWQGRISCHSEWI